MKLKRYTKKQVIDTLTTMKTSLNGKLITTLQADLPNSFEERIAGRMTYLDNGEAGFYVQKLWVEDAGKDFPEFKEEEESIYVDLMALFAEFPDYSDVILFPK